ncbi:ATP-dependent DNA helicase pif1 [Trifolium repens]|nr:ATP-dependent DNA helicase pif1 [Trifolium repens]
MCIIGASSHIISFARRISSAEGSLGPISHVEYSSILIGMENREWAVLPPGISKAAMPLDATVRTISPFDRNAVDNALQIYVLPVPP